MEKKGSNGENRSFFRDGTNGSNFVIHQEAMRQKVLIFAMPISD
jgi:hypothetical protein